MENGFFVSIAYAYPDGIIDNIGLSKEGVFDKNSWNVYAKWYQTLNNSLNKTSKRIAKVVNGISLPATSEGMSSTVKFVKEYFPSVVSHRVHAEHSGIGWRGRNSLIINPVYSCMIRLAGVITSQSLFTTPKLDTDCGNCTSCHNVCTFLKHKDRLDDYREQCLAYMNWLGLEDEVCGKCIKACVNSPIMSAHDEPLIEFGLSSLFYKTPI
jgi:epoxyqueuosine reductase QueG